MPAAAGESTKAPRCSLNHQGLTLLLWTANYENAAISFSALLPIVENNCIGIDLISNSFIFFLNDFYMYGVIFPCLYRRDGTNCLVVQANWKHTDARARSQQTESLDPTPNQDHWASSSPSPPCRAHRLSRRHRHRSCGSRRHVAYRSRGTTR